MSFQETLSTIPVQWGICVLEMKMVGIGSIVFYVVVGISSSALS